MSMTTPDVERNSNTFTMLSESPVGYNLRMSNKMNGCFIFSLTRRHVPLNDVILKFYKYTARIFYYSLIGVRWWQSFYEYAIR
jgi:hypothetical protein